MCGIAGIYTSLTTSPKELNLVQQMLEVTKHRGPDNQGLWSDDQVVLGHNLLSIIGVGTGRQPMSNINKDIWITFNGEIYNYKEIRESLKIKGYFFRTETDTEVLIYLYQEYGLDLVNYINGMFAFVIWDSKKKELIMFRDRLGVKPLFILRNKKQIIFASEIKAFKNLNIDLGGINPQAIINYLRFKHVGSRTSIFKSIIKVPPAHIVIIKKEEIKMKKYWNPISNKTQKYDPNQIRGLLRDATKLRLQSDVPLSISLSGGIDSSIVAYEAIKGNGYQGDVFSIKYPGKNEDESQIASRFASELGVRQNIIDFPEIDTNLLVDLVEVMDEPFSDYSFYPSFLLFSEQSKFSTVVLTGDGGDEAFGGYSRYSRFKKLSNYLKFISVARNLIPEFLHKNFPSKIKFLLTATTLDKRYLYTEILSMERKDNLENIFKSDFLMNLMKSYNSSDDPFKGVPDNTNNLESVMDYLNYLPGDVLAKVDLTSMHSSVEARSPFLDFRVAELGLSLQDVNRFSKGKTKIALRNAYKDRLPDYILNAKKKGFTVPYSYFTNPKFIEFGKQLLLDNPIICDQIFSQEKFEKYLFKKKKFTKLNAVQFWNFVMLELWFKANKELI